MHSVTIGPLHLNGRYRYVYIHTHTYAYVGLELLSVKVYANYVVPVEFAQCGSNAGELASPSIGFTLQLSPTEHDYYRVTSTTTVKSIYSHWPSMSATPQKNVRQMRISTLLVGGIYNITMTKKLTFI